MHNHGTRRIKSIRSNCCARSLRHCRFVSGHYLQGQLNCFEYLTSMNAHANTCVYFHVCAGTNITQASECFVHWKDSRHDNEWGLNFTTPVDARRFRDCCMVGFSFSLHYIFLRSSNLGAVSVIPSSVAIAECHVACRQSSKRVNTYT